MTLNTKDIDELATRLRDRRSELARKLMVYEDSLDAARSKDWQDRATEQENDEVIEGLGVSGMQELQMIDAALHRVDGGIYGECLNCGEDISLKRLRAVPQATLCIKCMAH